MQRGENDDVSLASHAALPSSGESQVADQKLQVRQRQVDAASLRLAKQTSAEPQQEPAGGPERGAARGGGAPRARGGGGGGV